LGVSLAGAGFYVIYTNKNANNYSHFMSYHAQFGVAILVSCIGLGMVGGVVLHPDFGVDKTNKTIRFAHKTGARVVLAGAWMCCVSGMAQLTTDPMSLAIVALPLMVLFPFTLV
jgi:Eukaryotic cytochrome b561